MSIDMKKLVTQPIFFDRNRVYRVYTGGMPYVAFFNDPDGYDLGFDGGEDGNFPEEWVASSVKALNEKMFGERDGVSVVKGTGIYFDDLLAAYPDELLGGGKYDCLVKVLDSAVRLPFQAHPTKEFSRKHFGSNYGKTEAWLVLGTRENARIYFGFKEQMTKEDIDRLEVESETDKTVFDDLLSYVEPKIGDVFLIRAGMVHAIGAGCTILELQEPTDFTVQPERWCGDHHLSPHEEYLGLDKDIALDVFDFSLYGPAATESARLLPRVVKSGEGYQKEVLIGYEDTPCFAQNRYTLTGGSYLLDGAPALYICVDGEGELCGEDYHAPLHRGSYFFLPYAAKGRFTATGNCTLVECLPSKGE